MPIIDFVSFQSKEDKVEEARNQHPIPCPEAAVLSDEPVNLRHNGVAAQSHYEQRRADFGEFAQIVYGQRPDGGAYVAEIVRSGIMSIDRGQMEA